MIDSNTGFREGQRQIFDFVGPNQYKLFCPDDFSKIRSDEFYTFMRFTYSDGFNYVFAVKTWLTKSEWTNSPNQAAASQCITNDCTIKRRVGTLGQFKFQNGPTEVHWGLLTNSYSRWDLTVK